MTVRNEVAKLALRFARWCNADAGVTQIDYGEVGMCDARRSGWYRNETRELFDGFSIDPSDTVADIGCGAGTNSNFCAAFASHTIAVDVDPEQVATTERLLRSRGLTNFATIVSDGNPLPIGAATADKIICTEVLEHVDDPAQMMFELVRIGKPGAQYLLSVPGALSERVLKQLSPPESYQKPNHIRVFESDQFERIVTDAGLTVTKHSFYSFYWTVWNALFWQCNVVFRWRASPGLGPLGAHVERRS